jgi:PBSX family phage terminase large subunit
LNLSPKQKWSIRGSSRRINVWEGAIRSGKTVASLIRWVQYVGRDAPTGAPLAMVGKTERTLRNNILSVLKWIVGDAFTYSIGNGTGKLFGHDILMFGASDERAEGKIRGLTCAGAYCDEVTLWSESVWKMLLSRCSLEGAKLFATTNPDGPYHWFKTGFLDRIDELDIASFHFNIEDNPFLSTTYINSIKKEYVGLWHKRFIEGLWVLAEGAVYDFFCDVPPYVIDKPPCPAYYVFGCDYGSRNPFVVGLFGVNPQTTPKVWLEREYWYCGRDSGRTKTDSEYADDVTAWLGGIMPQTVYIDPSAQSFIAELSRRGYNCTDPDNSVADGIRTQSRMLKSGEYAICRGCTNTINEYFAYIWDAKAQARGIDAPLKQNDHTKDMERYVLHSGWGSTERANYDILSTM